LDNTSAKRIKKLGKIVLYKQVMLSGMMKSTFGSSKCTFLWKDYFMKAAILDLYDILLACTFQIKHLI